MHCFVQAVLFCALLVSMVCTPCAADENPQRQAERPYLTLFISSHDRILQACETVFESIDRPDLAQSIGERLTGYRDFAGIERTKPAGIMTTWDDEKPLDVVFVPKTEIEELLKTATFGVVGFHEVSPDHYEIERPGSPYHVLIQKDYAFFADSVSTIRALRVSPLQLTQGLRDKYDMALKADLLQIPQATKSRWIEEIRRHLEPWLQPQDYEDAEQANLIKNMGKLALEVIERIILDTKSVTIGGRLDPKSRHISVELSIESVSRSRLAAIINQLKSYRSEYAALVQPDVAAGLAFNLPLGGVLDQLQGNKGKPESNHSRMEVGLQLVGAKVGDLSLIAALHGPDVEGMNEAIPRWLGKLERAGQVADLRENFEIHNGVVLHSLIPHELPASVAQWTGSEIEVIVGQAANTVWLGIGQAPPLLERLCEAIDLVADMPENQVAGPVVKGQFRAKALPDLLATDLLNSDSEAARKEFSRGDDGFNLTLEPFPDGLKLRVEFEEGFVRLIGRGWVQQMEESQTR